LKLDEFRKMADDEASHWWYRSRRELLRHALAGMDGAGGSGNGSRLRILDLASACGGNFSVCSAFGEPFGIDISPVSVAYCKARNGTRMIQGDAQRLPFADASFDVVVAFDVFEHLPHDEDSMRETFRILEKGRWLVFNVPACPALFSAHDEAFDHCRRYAKRELTRKLTSAGFTVEFMSHWSFFLLPLVYAARRVIKLNGASRAQAASDFQHAVPRPADWIMGLLSRLEVSLMKRRGSFPWGVSLYGVCRKPTD